MPRGPRFDVPGIVYHVICRGVERKEIFKSSKDYRFMLGKLATIAHEEQVKVYAFCLMPNHVHLMVKPTIKLSTFMRRLLTSYALYFNKQYKRSGHLFQNRYASFSVQHGVYFLELIRYIHLNPLRAGIVLNLENLSLWPYSGHATLMGTVKNPFFEAGETLALFADSEDKARTLLAKFMAEALVEIEEDAAGKTPALTDGVDESIAHPWRWRVR